MQPPQTPRSPRQAGAITIWLLGRGSLPHRKLLVGSFFACIAGVTFLAYANSLTGELVFDNARIIGTDERLRSLDHVGEILTTNYWAGTSKSANFRPLTTLSYLFNYTVLGQRLEPFGYHLVNTILHAVTALLVAFLALRLGAIPIVALGAGALFAVHPITTEAVANIVGRADVLAALFVLAGLLAHLRTWGSARPWRWWSVAAFFYMFAMASKESAVVFIALALAADLLFARRLGVRIGARRWLCAYAGYAAVMAAMQAWRLTVVGGEEYLELSPIDNVLVLGSFVEREATVVKLIALYALRIAFPLHLSADHSYRQIELVQGPGDLLLWIGGALLAGVFAGIARSWRRGPFVAFSLVLLVVAFAPVCNAFLLIGTAFAERLAYLPLVGFVFIVASGVAALARRTCAGEGRRTVAVAFTILTSLTVLLGVRTVMRNRDWQDELTFWRATHEASPLSTRAVNGYATAFFTAHPDRPGEAARLQRRILEIDADDRRGLANLALFLALQAEIQFRVGRQDEVGRLADEAESHARRGVTIDERIAVAWMQEHPSFQGGREVVPVREPRLYRALGKVLALRGALASLRGGDGTALLHEAEACLRRAILLQPDDPHQIAELVTNLIAQGQFEDALVAGLWALETSHGVHPGLGELLGAAYRGAGLDPARFLRVRPGLVDLARSPGATDAESRRHEVLVVKAFRMLLRILLAGGHERSARSLYEYAVTRRGVPREALGALFERVQRPGEPGFWE
ncbi:MAG: hypothetical protein AB1486_09400 [Planctomycetota bacterium]